MSYEFFGSIFCCLLYIVWFVVSNVLQVLAVFVDNIMYIIHEVNGIQQTAVNVFTSVEIFKPVVEKNPADY